MPLAATALASWSSGLELGDVAEQNASALPNLPNPKKSGTSASSSSFVSFSKALEKMDRAANFLGSYARNQDAIRTEQAKMGDDKMFKKWTSLRWRENQRLGRLAQSDAETAWNKISAREKNLEAS
mmetsp:Transcript_22688/g.57482  ORF Transcript_22688/g.57482 Transcript_22688/m.57482 type:complete len:126 (+) Transcript_22688:131-508(+)